MKLSNIFKKHTKIVAKANVEKLKKNQLEKVVGGADTTTVTDPIVSDNRVGRPKYSNIKL